MSITKFKVGDKVRVRNNITGCGDTCRDGVYVNEKMAKIAGAIFTIDGVTKDYYDVAENDWGWNDEMLEPAEKTLDNLCAGDHIKSGDEVKMVLAALNSCYLLSNLKTYDVADKWYTAEQLKVDGFELFDPQAKAIEIDGKTYDEAEVKKAIKDLEPIR
nr:MAG TPA: mindbomb E3 ubiquitin protein ligase [Caudoviricetes sp.]